MRTLTLKQQRFVAEYAIDLNAKQAAIRAGYSRRTAEVIGYELLQKTSVRAHIDSVLGDRAERTQLTADCVVKYLQTIVNRCMEPVEITDSLGEGTGVYKFDSRGACKALELLGKHLGMFDGPAGQQHLHLHAPAVAPNSFIPPIREVIVNRLASGQIVGPAPEAL